MNENYESWDKGTRDTLLINSIRKTGNYKVVIQVLIVPYVGERRLFQQNTKSFIGLCKNPFCLVAPELFKYWPFSFLGSFSYVHNYFPLNNADEKFTSKSWAYLLNSLNVKEFEVLYSNSTVVKKAFWFSAWHFLLPNNSSWTKKTVIRWEESSEFVKLKGLKRPNWLNRRKQIEPKEFSNEQDQ